MELGTASFRGTKDVQASWRKSENSIDITISDYLFDAPDDVLSEFSRYVCQTAVGKKPVYGKAYTDWVRSDEFIISKRKIYLGRSRNLTCSPEGNERDLTESLDRLLDSGLLDAKSISNSFFSWTKSPNARKMGFCSQMMRVVGISSILDDVSVPEFVLDYVVYHESLHLAQGHRPGMSPHDRPFRIEEKKYPKYEEARQFLKKLSTKR